MFHSGDLTCKLLCINIVVLRPHNPIGAVGKVFQVNCELTEAYFNEFPNGTANNITFEFKRLPFDNWNVKYVSKKRAEFEAIPNNTIEGASCYCLLDKWRSDSQIFRIGSKLISL